MTHIGRMEPDETQESWRRVLTGDIPHLRRLRRVMSTIPTEPRCKLCAAPFGRPGHSVLRHFGYAQSRLNRRLCTKCLRRLGEHPGGAEVEITLLFADVRGSTALAERMSAQEYSKLIARFYGAAAHEVDGRDGIVDKFVGDGVVALFIPGFAGDDHAAKAVAAARELVRATGNDGAHAWIPIGVGVHTGVSFVGRVGEGDAYDFTALGDPVNATARLSSEAGAGEVLVSVAAASAAGVETHGLERRTLLIRGRDETIDAWVLGNRLPPAAEAPA
jgi:adenylate cyclase